MGKLLADVHRLHLSNQDLCILRDIHACQLSDRISALTNNFCVQRTIDQDGLANLIDLALLQEIAASVNKFFLYILINGSQNRHGLLGGTDHTIIKGLGMDDGIYRQLNVRSLINDNRRISRADAYRRLSGRVCGFHHARTAGSQDQICVAHYFVGKLQRRHVNPPDDSLRRSRFHRRVQNHLGRRDGTLLCPGVRGNNDCVPGL